MEDGASDIDILCWGKECRGECSSQMARDDQKSCNTTKTLANGSIAGIVVGMRECIGLPLPTENLVDWL